MTKQAQITRNSLANWSTTVLNANSRSGLPAKKTDNQANWPDGAA